VGENTADEGEMAKMDGLVRACTERNGAERSLQSMGGDLNML
jgi:hypothetical protein